jgi:SAM-dependent methyltransferase
MELAVFSRLGGGTQSAAALAASIGVEEARLARLLDALVVAGLLERDGAAYRNSPEAATFLVDGKPDDMSGEHELLRQLWQADFMTAASIRSGRPEAEHDFAAGVGDAAARFQRGLMPSTRAFGRDLAKAIDIPSAGSALDVGGGPAGVLISLGEAAPALQLTLLELPSVAAIVAPMLQASADGPRIEIEEGDIVAAPARKRHDLVILKAVVQVLPPEDAARAIRHCFESLKPRGRLVIGGAGMLDDTRLSPASAVYYNLTFMNLYRRGESYTRSQYLAWLEAAGFSDPHFVGLASGSTILCCRRD